MKTNIFFIICNLIVLPIGMTTNIDKVSGYKDVKRTKTNGRSQSFLLNTNEPKNRNLKTSVEDLQVEDFNLFKDLESTNLTVLFNRIFDTLRSFDRREIKVIIKTVEKEMLTRYGMKFKIFDLLRNTEIRTSVNEQLQKLWKRPIDLIAVIENWNNPSSDAFKETQVRSIEMTNSLSSLFLNWLNTLNDDEVEKAFGIIDDLLSFSQHKQTFNDVNDEDNYNTKDEKIRDLVKNIIPLILPSKMRTEKVADFSKHNDISVDAETYIPRKKANKYTNQRVNDKGYPFTGRFADHSAKGSRRNVTSLVKAEPSTTRSAISPSVVVVTEVLDMSFLNPSLTHDIAQVSNTTDELTDKNEVKTKTNEDILQDRVLDTISRRQLSSEFLNDNEIYSSFEKTNNIKKIKNLAIAKINKPSKASIEIIHRTKANVLKRNNATDLIINGNSLTEYSSLDIGSDNSIDESNNRVPVILALVKADDIEEKNVEETLGSRRSGNILDENKKAHTTIIVKSYRSPPSRTTTGNIQTTVTLKELKRPRVKVEIKNNNLDYNPLQRGAEEVDSSKNEGSIDISDVIAVIPSDSQSDQHISEPNDQHTIIKGLQTSTEDKDVVEDERKTMIRRVPENAQFMNQKSSPTTDVSNNNNNSLKEQPEPYREIKISTTPAINVNRRSHSQIKKKKYEQEISKKQKTRYESKTRSPKINMNVIKTNMASIDMSSTSAVSSPLKPNVQTGKGLRVYSGKTPTESSVLSESKKIHHYKALGVPTKYDTNKSGMFDWKLISRLVRESSDSVSKDPLRWSWYHSVD